MPKLQRTMVCCTIDVVGCMHLNCYRYAIFCRRERQRFGALLNRQEHRSISSLLNSGSSRFVDLILDVRSNLRKPL